MSQSSLDKSFLGRGVVLVVGSLNMDLVVQVAAQPRPGDTVLASDVQTFPGGKGANQASAAARAGGRVRMLGRVGTDGYGRALKTALESVGVDIGFVGEASGPSGLAFITVDAGGENMIVVSSGVNRRLEPGDLSDEHFEDVAVVLMQLESPLEVVARAAELARARSIPVILNAAPARELPGEVLGNVTHLVVNEGEAGFLAGMSVTDAATARAAGEKLLGLGVGNVVITLGGDGVAWLGESEGRLSAHGVQVVDTTAAGDAFCGAFAVKLAEASTLAEAARFANAAGALATTKAGAQPSLPSRIAIEELVNQPL